MLTIRGWQRIAGDSAMLTRMAGGAPRGGRMARCVLVRRAGRSDRHHRPGRAVVRHWEPSGSARPDSGPGSDAPNCIAAGPGPSNTGDEVRDGLVAAAGTVLSLINPLAELVFQLGDVGMSLFRERKVATSPDPSDLFGFFDDLVHAVIARGGTVVLIVDADHRDEDLWSRRFTQFTARAGRLQHQRLAMVVGLPDAPPDAGDVDATFPKLVATPPQLSPMTRPGGIGSPR